MRLALFVCGFSVPSVGGNFSPSKLLHLNSSHLNSDTVWGGAFLRADWGGKFVGVSKKKWITSYLALDAGSPMISIFKNLGEGPLDEINMKYFEMFVCSVYSSTS